MGGSKCYSFFSMKQIFLIATLINIISIVVAVFISMSIFPKTQEDTPKIQEDVTKAQEDVAIPIQEDIPMPVLEKVAQRTTIQNHCGAWQLETDIDFIPRNKTKLTTALLELDKYFIPLSIPVHGGGLDSCGRNLIILSGDTGKLLKLDMASMQLQELPVALPNNGKDELTNFAKSFEKEIQVLLHRYNDIAFWVDNKGDLFLLISYSYWNSQEECFTSRLAKTKVTKELSELDSKDINWDILFETSPCFPPKELKGTTYAGNQAGGAIYALNSEEVVLTVGDYDFDGRNNDPMYPQSLNVHYGKTFKVKVEDGAIELLSIGHRNQQGITVDDFGRIWSVEHGPEGGDELNLIKADLNYGWPYVTNGTNYGKFEWPFSKAQGRHDGFEKPIYAWAPSIGISNVEVVRDFIDLWNQDLLVTSLKGKILYRVRTHDERIVFAEPIELDGRLRYAHSAGSKTIAILVDGNENNANILILRPSIEAIEAEAERVAGVDSSQEVSSQKDIEVEAAFTRCLECHTDQTASNSVPSLRGVYGRKAGSADSDGYSDALVQSGINWNEGELLEYLKDPNGLIEGTLMPNPGISKEQTLKGLVEILKDY